MIEAVTQLVGHSAVARLPKLDVYRILYDDFVDYIHVRTRASPISPTFTGRRELS